ncbi:hypothetical protein B0T16DRAFT_486723 [Cercophora newfieldiana]|uniref:Uncharacterized protein n=1 Tax=Cercophora newfieldiana TaxID=92897 RepID=A0AA39YPV3_9PEZI|nr:hypothetical protein B0T16DRAFT_486723 [Cercophora newfieldiana]
MDQVRQAALEALATLAQMRRSFRRIRHETAFPAGKKIRVIELLPGQYHETISCKFSTVTLKDPPKPGYVALTYATEDPTVYQPIKLNDKLFAIPDNLVLALKRIRSKTTPIFL